MYVKLLAFFAFTILLTSCGTFVETASVIRNETLCEPWFENESLEYGDLQARRIMKKYFRENGLDVYKLRLEDESWNEVICLACNCRTGRVIACDVKVDQLQDFRALGFEVTEE